jgi:hypothetical protein
MRDYPVRPGGPKELGRRSSAAGALKPRAPGVAARPRRRFALALALATSLWPGSLGAQAPAAAPRDPLAPLDRFLGSWAGPGTLQGSKARLELRFERTLGNRFLRIQHQNRVETPRGEMLFEGLSIYRPKDAGFAATWYDSFGHVYPVTASLEGDALRAEWGTPEIEQGITLYRLTAPGTLEVTDSVKRQGAFQEFARATLQKQ